MTDRLLIQADAKRIPLADGSVHCVVTSPPYFGLRSYLPPGHPLKPLEMGLEETPEAFVAGLVEVFREVRRVLRDDGTVWLNIGDSFCNNPGNGRGGEGAGLSKGGRPPHRSGISKLGLPGIKTKDLMMIPARLALALQFDGWYLRQEICWSKRNCMPESVTDRPARSHEMVYLLSKRPRYYYDTYAIRTLQKTAGERHEGKSGYREGHPSKGGISRRALNPHGAGERSVWHLSSNSFKGGHFATMPLALAEKCIRLGSSQKGCCPRCGTPWRRVIEKTRVPTRPGNDSKVGRASAEPGSPYEGHAGMAVGNRDPKRHVTVVRLLGWESACTCLEPAPVPCTVFDPFAGVASTGVAAGALGRRFVGTDLSADYLAMARERLDRPHKPRKRPRELTPTPLFGDPAR